MICDRCIELRQRISSGESVPDKSVTALLQELSELRKTLQDAAGAMTPDQKRRFHSVQQRYAKASGSPDPGKEENRMRALPSQPGPPARTTRPRVEVSAPHEEQAPVIRDTLLLPKATFLLSGTVLSLPPATLGPSPANPPENQLQAPSLSFDVQALYGYGKASSYGLMAAVGVGQHWGAWLAARYNFIPTGSKYDCTSDGRTAGGRFWSSGNSRYGILSLSVGPLWRPLPWLGIYAGAGYDREELDWEDIGKQWARVQDYSYSGLCGNVGVLLHWKFLSLSVGCTWSNHATITFGLGIHYPFTKKLSNP